MNINFFLGGKKKFVSKINSYFGKKK
jgi:hypothetical protein